MQDLYSTYPAQETCATVDDADYTGPTRQHELDHTRSRIDISASKYLDNELWESMVDSSEVVVICPRCEQLSSRRGRKQTGEEDGNSKLADTRSREGSR